MGSGVAQRVSVEASTEVRFHRNRFVEHAVADTRSTSLLPSGPASDAMEAIRGWQGYTPTPLVNLPGLAAACGVGSIWVKDEGVRFGLGSFKALGGAYAVARISERIRGNAPRPTVTSATDGNHGRSVAWGARRAGCPCVIYLHEDVSNHREQAIAAYGAEIVRTSGNYDDAARRCARDAEERGWTVVSDTAPTGDPGCALEVMQGYRLLMDEALEQMNGQSPTHVFLQAGCGGLAAAVRAHLGQVGHDTQPLPKIVVVEPVAADCLLRSSRVGHSVVVAGGLETVMAGLAVGEPSGPAWEILGPGVDAFMAIPDAYALETMRVLADGVDGDPPVVAGETGAAGLSALVAAGHAGIYSQLELDADSRVLAINTEADTDPRIYAEIVGRSAEAVRAGDRDHHKETR